MGYRRCDEDRQELNPEEQNLAWVVCREKLVLCWRQSCEPGSAGDSRGPERVVDLRETRAECLEPSSMHEVDMPYPPFFFLIYFYFSLWATMDEVVCSLCDL